MNEEERREGIHTGQLLYSKCCQFLDEIDEFADTNHHEALAGMVNDYAQQRVLVDASSIAVNRFLEDDQYTVRYVNTFFQQIPPLINEMFRAADPDETGIKELTDIYREWGPLCETVVQPMVAIVHYAENDEVDLYKAEEMNFHDQLKLLREHHHLEPVAEHLHVKHRNAFAHGEWIPNQIAEEVTMFYSSADGRVEVTYSIEEFRELVVKTVSAVMALFIAPMYLVSAYASIEITAILASMDES